MSDSLRPCGLARQAPLSMGFSIGIRCYAPRPHLGIEPMSPAATALQADSLLLSQRGSPN